MAATKIKLVGIAIILGILSLALVLVEHQNSMLRRELEAARASVLKDTAPGKGRNGFSELGVSSEELRQLRREHLEVLSLRGRVTQLANEIRGKKDGPIPAQEPANSESEPRDSILFTAASTNHVRDGHTLVVGGWSMKGMRGYLLATPEVQLSDGTTDERKLELRSVRVGAPESFWEQIGWGAAKSDERRSTIAGVLTPEQADALLNALKDTSGAEISTNSSVTNRSGNQMGFGYSMDDGQGAKVLMSMDLIPRITADGEAVDLELRPSAVSLNSEHSSPAFGERFVPAVSKP